MQLNINQQCEWTDNKISGTKWRSDVTGFHKHLLWPKLTLGKKIWWCGWFVALTRDKQWPWLKTWVTKTQIIKNGELHAVWSIIQWNRKSPRCPSAGLAYRSGNYRYLPAQLHVSHNCQTPAYKPNLVEAKLTFTVLGWHLFYWDG